MANTIQIKRSSTATETPSASDLAVGELAVNTADAKLFTKHTDGTVKELAGGGGSGISAVVDDTSPQLGGNLDTNDKNIQFGDSSGATVNRLLFGNSSDFQMYHNASNSYIDNYVGDIYIRNGTADRDVIIQSDDGSGGLSTYFQADGSTGSANLFHYGSIKLYTGSGGVDVVGDLTVTSTDAGATENPTLDLYRNSASPAVNDVLGHIVFNGENDAGEKIKYAEIESIIADDTDGTEDGRLDIRVISTGSDSLRVAFQGNGVTRFVNRDIELATGLSLRFEGSSDDDHELFLSSANPTADRTITLPDQTGTSMVALFYDSFASTEQDLSGSTYITVDFDTNRQNSDTAVFSESAGEVTIAKAGVYMLSYEVTLGNKSSSRTEGLIRMSRKPSGGSYSEIAGSLSATYNRNSSTDVTTGSASVMFTVTAGDVFKVEAKRNSGSGGLVVFANGCRFNIMALKIG